MSIQKPICIQVFLTTTYSSQKLISHQVMIIKCRTMNYHSIIKAGKGDSVVNRPWYTSRTQVWIPRTHKKPRKPVTPTLGNVDKLILGIQKLASLALMASFQFNERTVWKKDNDRKTSDVLVWPLHVRAQVPKSQHSHTYTNSNYSYF